MVTDLLVADGNSAEVALERLSKDRIEGLFLPQLEGRLAQQKYQHKSHLFDFVIDLPCLLEKDR